jgi:hypothetical protein
VRFSLRSALHDVEHALSPARLALPLHLEGANTRLLALAYRRAGGGLITGCKPWGQARWRFEAGIDRQLVGRLEAHGLVRWEGEDLRVLEYVYGHERRIRGLCAVQIPAMMAARGYDPDAYHLNGCAEGVGGPDRPGGGGTGSNVSTQRSYLHPPLTSRLTSQLTPDPGSAPRRARAPSDPDPSRRRPPDHPDPDRSDHPTEAGPEGFERWWSAMPVPRQRQPRDPRVWPAWRERALEYWVRHDLEGEADDVLAELERRKLSDAWVKTPWYIPSGINFLRAASWRAGRRRAPPAKVNAPEVFVPSTTWRPRDARLVVNGSDEVAAAERNWQAYAASLVNPRERS